MTADTVNLLEYYNTAREYILDSEYRTEMEWCENREPFKNTNEATFFCEYVYVVLNAGMREQVARKIYNRFFDKLDFNVIGHLDKRKAIKEASLNYKKWFKEVQQSDNKIEHLKSLP